MQLWEVSFYPKGGYGNGLFVVVAETAEQARAVAQSTAEEGCYEGEFATPQALPVKLAPDNKPEVVTYQVYIS